MSVPWAVLWWQTREQIAKNWTVLAAGTILAFLCVLGWVSAVANQEHPDLAAIARRTAIYFCASLLAASILGFALLARGHLKGWISSTVAERAVTGVARTLLSLSVIGIILGIVIYGGTFLHIELFLKLVHHD